MKNILLIITGATIPIIIAGLGYIYIQNSMPEPDIWSHENRHMLYETYSPNKKYKIGVYNYDSGALGYTSAQVSMVKSNEKYPLAGNILRQKYINSVNWLSNEKAEFFMKTTDKLNTKVIITVK